MRAPAATQVVGGWRVGMDHNWVEAASQRWTIPASHEVNPAQQGQRLLDFGTRGRGATAPAVEAAPEAYCSWGVVGDAHQAWSLEKPLLARGTCFGVCDCWCGVVRGRLVLLLFLCVSVP